MNPRTRLRRGQAGYSMVSIMVGLVISLLTVGAMLAVYRTVVEVSGQASADAVRDGQVASGLLAAQMELHNAGYKVDELPALAEGEVADTSVISRYAIAVQSNDKRVVTWRYLDDATAQKVCAQLRIQPSADGGLEMLYRTPEPCADITGKTSWSGRVQRLVSYPRAWQDRSGTPVAAAASGSYLDMGAADANSGFRLVTASGQRCTLPFAQRDPALAPTESPRLVLERAGQELFSVCLPNIVAERRPSAAPAASGGEV